MATTQRASNPTTVTLPSSELVSSKAVAKAITEYSRLRSMWADTGRQLRQLEGGRREAEAADRDALSKALRAGSEDPGQPATREHVAQVAEARRRLDALRQALTEAEHELADVLAKHGAKWQEDLGRTLEATEREYVQVVEQLASLRDRRAELGGLARWAHDFPGSRHGYKPAARPEVGRLQRGHGVPVTWPEILEALRLDASTSTTSTNTTTADTPDVEEPQEVAV